MIARNGTGSASRCRPILFVLALLVTACQGGVPRPTPTPPEASDLTMVAIASQIALAVTATAHAQPAVTLALGTAAPTILDNTPERITLHQPGPASVVSSPVRVRGQILTPSADTVMLDLTNASGTRLVHTPVPLQRDRTGVAFFDVWVDFTVPDSQPGRIAVYCADAYGPQHLTSVEVILDAHDAAFINPAPQQTERLVLQTPRANEALASGALHISGWSSYVFENQLVVLVCGDLPGDNPRLLCGSEANVLAVGFAYVASPEVGLAGFFETTVAYGVTHLTPARVLVYSESPRDGGFVHLASQAVILKP